MNEQKQTSFTGGVTAITVSTSGLHLLESGFIYHRARAALVPLAVLPWGLYLALPVTVHPLLILLPAAILLGLAVNIAAGSFKKYL